MTNRLDITRDNRQSNNLYQLHFTDKLFQYFILFDFVIFS